MSSRLRESYNLLLSRHEEALDLINRQMEILKNQQEINVELVETIKELTNTNTITILH